jgi:hypothetical protein
MFLARGHGLVIRAVILGLLRERIWYVVQRTLAAGSTAQGGYYRVNPGGHWRNPYDGNPLVTCARGQGMLTVWLGLWIRHDLEEVI